MKIREQLSSTHGRPGSLGTQGGYKLRFNGQDCWVLEGKRAFQFKEQTPKNKFGVCLENNRPDLSGGLGIGNNET